MAEPTKGLNLQAQGQDPRPPPTLKSLFKHYRRTSLSDLDNDARILRSDSLCGIAEPSPFLRSEPSIDFSAIRRSCAVLGVTSAEAMRHIEANPIHSFSIKALPGLTVIPGLIPPAVQPALLDTLLHDCLSNPANKTNVHAHHRVPYPSPASSGSPSSFFHGSPDATSPGFEPRDPALHTSFTTTNFLNEKLHWLTLGAQYDWTTKQYPLSSPPFPTQLAQFLRPLFPALIPEAAIVNLYSAGDTLGLHRDVAETSGRELVSLSLGCEALFLAGLEGKGDVVLKLGSGDCVVLAGEARWAWHGVPRILEGTCPKGLGQWPAGEGKEVGDFESWRGWMTSRRVNLSVRQVGP